MSDTETRQCFVRQSNFADLLEGLPAEQQDICQQLRRLLLGLPVSLSEVVWRQQGIISYGVVSDAAVTDNFFFISINDDKVQLGFYYAAILADPNALLDDSGQFVINTTDVLQSEALKALLLAGLQQRYIR